MKQRQTQADRIERLEAALEEVARENERLAGEIEALQAESQIVLELFAALLYAWREDEDLQPVMDAVAAELQRRQGQD